MSKVIIEQLNGAQYPTAINDFNPGKVYPEYPFENEAVSEEPNDAYELIRNSLKDMGLDAENFGTSQWNPLGAYIKTGDFVIVKPNLVMHENENKSAHENAFECLITNPACIRAVCDH